VARCKYGPSIAVALNDRPDYPGSTVSLAARLEGLSSGADVIVSEAKRLQRLIDDLRDIVHFAAGQPGWRSDRGRIYLRNGPPDEVKQQGAHGEGGRLQSRALGWEVWRYTSSGKDRFRISPSALMCSTPN